MNFSLPPTIWYRFLVAGRRIERGAPGWIDQARSAWLRDHMPDEFVCPNASRLARPRPATPTRALITARTAGTTGRRTAAIGVRARSPYWILSSLPRNAELGVRRSHVVWARVDDEFHRHEKVAALLDRELDDEVDALALGAWVLMLSF